MTADIALAEDVLNHWQATTPEATAVEWSISRSGDDHRVSLSSCDIIYIGRGRSYFSAAINAIAAFNKGH